MSQCYNCGKYFTLTKEDLTCDSCGKVVNFCCHSCKEWFSVYDDNTKEKRKECRACGFFICPTCGACGTNCIKDYWQVEITKILSPEINFSNTPKLQEKVNKILSFIEEIKLNRDQKSCSRGVPISYAKQRIKSCVVRMRGFRIKDEIDMKQFSQRVSNILDKNIGDLLTVEQSRDKGSYGQEYRDVFNLCLCSGKLEKIKVSRVIDGEEVEYEAYRRVEKEACPHLDLKDLIIKLCPKCKTNYSLEDFYCSKEECIIKKGKNKGNKRELISRVSTKDVCQLNRELFIKREDGKSKSY